MNAQWARPCRVVVRPATTLETCISDETIRGRLERRPYRVEIFRMPPAFGDWSAALPRDLAGALRRVGLCVARLGTLNRVGLRHRRPGRRDDVLELASAGTEVRQERPQFVRAWLEAWLTTIQTRPSRPQLFDFADSAISG